MSRKVFLSVLGTSFYRPCKYVQGDFKSDEISFIQQATIEMLNIPSEWDRTRDKIVIMLTERSFKYNWDKNIESREDNDKISKPYTGLNKVLIDMGLEDMILPVSIPGGENVAEIWNIFTSVFDILEDDDQLYLDITHSFRYLPMVMLVLCNYAKFLKNISVKSITYGNYEGRNKDSNEAPIVDLLPISLLQDWTSAAANYIKSGRTDELFMLSDGDMRKIRKENNTQIDITKPLNQTVRLLNDISLDFQLSRGLPIMLGTNFRKQDFDSGINTADIIPPLLPVLRKVVDSLDCFSNEMDVENIFNAAKWCYEKKMYQQTVTLLMEGVVSFVCVAIKVDILDKDIRGKISAILANFYKKDFDLRLNSLYCRIQDIALPNDFFNKYSSLVLIRNKINHAYIQKSGSISKITRDIKSISEALDYFISFVSSNELRITASEVYEEKPSVLLNLSNHPYSTWSENQKAAAAVYGECIDIKFPDIDAMSDEDDINGIVNEVISEIKSYTSKYKITIHVMGEMTFCFAIVKRLTDVGIKCIASCSKRQAEINDGVKTSVFEFERFRTYSYGKKENEK